MPKATICVDVDTPEQLAVDQWLKRWQALVPFVSENEGCGCCVDLYRVDAPKEALDELPSNVFCSDEWSGIGAGSDYQRHHPGRDPRRRI